MALNPVTGSKAIKDSYMSYLTTTFMIDDRDLGEQFQRLLSHPERLVKGPILQALPPFETSGSLKTLMDEGMLSSCFKAIPEEELPKDRPLYWHQDQAIRKAISGRRNLVIASGTGSGKTECFMVPILNSLMREHERGTLTPGVRALLLYPMNALANDQVKRLRQLLAHLPYITFGRYTGETKETQGEAHDLYFKMYGEEPLPNEKIARVRMRREPPHILLTNYAMLEYLLLRPEDTPFFDGVFANSWRFIALDEAHTYAGAKGIEIAMLLRRLKDRVVSGRKGMVQCFATSATLGNGEEDAPEIVRFARDLFDERFEYVKDDPQRQDVVVGRRIEYSSPCVETELFALKPRLFPLWRDALKDGGEGVLNRLVRIGEECDVPRGVLREALELSEGDVDSFLFHALKREGYLMKLRSRLMEDSVGLEEEAQALFPQDLSSTQTLVALVDLAVRAKPEEESAPLLPARYHVFVKAVEGAYLRFGPTKTLSLSRKTHEECDGRLWPVFEIATCRNCGRLYLYGHIDLVTDTFCQDDPEDGFKTACYFMVTKDKDITEGKDHDEDELVVFDMPEDPASEVYVLCTSCSKIWRRGSLGVDCSCGTEHHVLLLKSPSPGVVTCCHACGRRNSSGLVMRFLTGQDATATVIATSIYQSLSKGKSTSTEAKTSNVSVNRDDDWGFLGNPEDDWAPRVSDGSEFEPERLLVFSDSRQDAAFFAPYFERTYNRILERSLIYKTVCEHKEEILRDSWRVTDLVEPLVKAANDARVFTQALGLREQRNTVWTWILQEFLRYDRHNSLESLGMLGFSPAVPRGWRAPRPLLSSPWNLSPVEVWGVLRVLLDTLRTNGAVLFPSGVNPRDERFAPRNRPYYVRQSISDSKMRIFSWSPSRMVNTRLDFLTKVADRSGIKDPKNEAAFVLDKLWEGHLRPQAGAWAEYFQGYVLPKAGAVFQMRPDMWEVNIPGSGEDALYKCSRCGRISQVNVKGVCPNYRCDGTLVPFTEQEGFSENHYARLYKSLFPASLAVREHTAQLKPDEAASLQTQFTNGEVNVLSCSTTFELGVDLGTLEAVFLRNMPPTPANYVQRSGRAGRRTGSAAFVVTYAQRRPHDLEYFRNPERMVSGIIRPPHFKLANDKIIGRHVYAMALSYLWRTKSEVYGGGVVRDFFKQGNGVVQLEDLLESRPQPLLISLLRTVPDEVHQELGIRDWGWVHGLLDPQEGVLVKAAEEFESDTRILLDTLAELQLQKKPSDYILRALNTVESRSLLNYLAARGVLPKYGFPVDSVELRLNHHGPTASGLELERDLRLALSEYAPGSAVIAGGKMWTSRYLRLLPKRTWMRYRYAICDNCGSYERVLSESEERPSVCACCGTQLLKSRHQGIYLVPEFGFGSEYGVMSDAPMSKPQKSPYPRVYFYGPSLGESGHRACLDLGSIRIGATSAAKGKLAALNTYGGAHFSICQSCGYGVPGANPPKKHTNSYGNECKGIFRRAALGHEFETDVLLIEIEGYGDIRDGFWQSLLYGLLEGLSLALDIERSDLDGCLYPKNGRLTSPALVLFDDVPGGAGHVRRAADAKVLKQVLNETENFLKSCECGSSCSGCLRNFRNQYWHSKLNRIWVVEFLERVLAAV